MCITMCLVCVGDLPKNLSLIREISSLCDQLPVLDSVPFERSFQDVSYNNYNY